MKLVEATLSAEDLPSLDDSVELVARSQAGDRDALSELLARYQERVHRIVRARLGSHLRPRVESMDIVQEALQAAARDIGALEVRDRACILQWLSAIATNRIRAAHHFHFAWKRDPGRGVGSTGTPARIEPGAEPPVSETSIPERAGRQELKDLVDEAISRLPETYREAIVLRDYCEAPWEVVAERLDRPSTGAARELHRRALVKLAAALGTRCGPG